MSAFPLRSIAIIGGGASTWLAAASLARVLGTSCKVRVVELAAQSAINGAVASVPSLHRLLRLLGLDEIVLMRATQATFRLGAEFRDWAALGERYFEGFGSIGAKLDAVPFQHHWLRLAAAGEHSPLEEYSVAAQAARLGRFAVPQSDPRSVLSLYSYAWHFDARLLAGYLRECALKGGVEAIADAVASVELDPEHGHVRTLVLESGTRLAADMFIDCGGEHGVLRAALGVESDDWSGWLPCDRMQTLRMAADDILPPFSEAQAITHGWQFSMPLQHCTVRGQVYGSEFASDDAVGALLSTAQGATPGITRDAPSVQRLVRGRPKEFWVNNCLLLPGDALDPLESTSLHLAQTGISRFLAHLPARLPGPAETAEYNRLTAEEYDRIRDLLVFHYHATTRTDSAFWKSCREMPVPESLHRRLALFADSGRIVIGEEEHCGVDGWLAVLSGQGMCPKSYDPLAETTPLANVRAALAGLSAEMRARAATLPLHREFIALRGATAHQLS